MSAVLKLPAELINQIASYMVYLDFLKFRGALKSKIVVSLTKKQLEQICHKTEKEYGDLVESCPELDDPLFCYVSPFGKGDNLVCYRCISIKHSKDFAFPWEKDIRDDLSAFGLGGRRFLERVCEECDAKAEGEFAETLREENEQLLEIKCVECCYEIKCLKLHWLDDL